MEQRTNPTDRGSQLAEFVAAASYTAENVWASPCPVPPAPGIYGWWFRRLPTQLNTGDCLTRSGLTLLYSGISPKRPPTNGRPPSKQKLRDRIRYHYRGNAEGSTLRKTLGILLSDALGIELRRVGSGKRMTFGTGEARLSEWMAENALVSWLVDPEPWLLEEQFIADLDVPLNLEGNSRNRFHPELTSRRAQAIARARDLPVLA
jgi:hypothetical protein